MLLKKMHVAFVILTFASFSLRSYWMYTGSRLSRHRAVRIAPHIIDLCLFLTGLSMVVRFYGDINHHPWLLYKLLGVCVYIILGSIALRPGKSRRIRLAAVFGAWAAFLYIIAMARSHAVIPY